MTEPDSSPLALIEKSAVVLYEEAPCGYIFTLPDGTLIKINQTFADWVGYSKSDLITVRRFQELLTIGSKIYYETNYAPLIRMQGFLNEITLDLKGKDGRIIPVLINSAEMKNEAGAAIAVKYTLFHIGERRKYERELLIARRKAEKAEQRLRFLAHAGDLLRQYVDWRSSLSELATLATQEFCDACTIEIRDGSEWKRVTGAHRSPERSLPFVDPLAQAHDVPSPLLVEDFPADFISEALPEKMRWVFPLIEALEPQSLITVPILLNGSLTGFVTFLMTELGRRFDHEDLELTLEITKRIATAIENAQLHLENERSAQALRESHEWFSTTLRSIGDAVIAVNTDSTVSFLNSVAIDLTGWGLEEARGRPMSDVFPIINDLTGEPAFNPVDTCLKEGVIVGLANNTALIRRDGTRIVIEDSAAPIRDDDGNIGGVVLVFRDVTEKHREEKEKEATLQRLHEERELREKFVATLTHDLRSPITAVKMNAELILKKPDEPDAVRRLAERVVKNVNRTDQMIQDLLDVSRIRAGEKMILEMEKCDLREIIQDALTELTTIHGARFELSAPPSVQGHWNSRNLRRIIENLCNNAVKYGGSDAPVTLRLRPLSTEVSIDVHNSGNPIPPDELPTLFEPYHRATTAHQGGQKGWGLGLTLVRGVTEAHGGRIHVESSAESGTTFTVLLPLDSRPLGNLNP